MTAFSVTDTESPDSGALVREGIRRLRQRTGISWAELGRRSGIGAQKLRDRMDAKTRLSIEECDAIASVLGCTMVDLIELGRGNDPKGLLLWALRHPLRLVASNDTVAPRRPARSPLLRSVQ